MSVSERGSEIFRQTIHLATDFIVNKREAFRRSEKDRDSSSGEHGVDGRAYVDRVPDMIEAGGCSGSVNRDVDHRSVDCDSLGSVSGSCSKNNSNASRSFVRPTQFKSKDHCSASGTIQKPDIRRTSSDQTPESEYTMSTKSSTSDEEQGVSTVLQQPVQATKKRPRRPVRKTIYEHTVKSIGQFEVCFHGPLWTWIGGLSSWIAVLLLWLARKSTRFVSLGIPIYIDPNFERVHEVGLINIELCHDQAYSGSSACMTHELATYEVQDSMFQLARSLLTVALLVGVVASVAMTSTVCWTTIRLRTLGVIYLLTYLIHAFSFMFFDSDLCKQRDCTMRSGAVMSVISSLFWIVACFAASKMDGVKYEKKLALQKARRRAQKYQNWFAGNDGMVEVVRANEQRPESDTDAGNGDELPISEAEWTVKIGAVHSQEKKLSRQDRTTRVQLDME